MGAPTSPPIFQAENTNDARRKVAAQARLYSDAKSWFYGRLWLITALAVGSAVAALLTSDTWSAVFGVGGGLVLLAMSFVGGGLEKRRLDLAVSVQEDFDTTIFQLAWNPICGVARPTTTEIGVAAGRYTGGRDGDWYDDTVGTHRPFDVLICQESNLGWGARTHRIWAWILCGLVVAILAALSLGAWAGGLTIGRAVICLVGPALAPLREVGEQARANFETARDKAAAASLINGLWADGMAGRVMPSEVDLRMVQDRILTFRQRNPYVPDWLDDRLHTKSERAMRATVADRVAEAARNGHG